MQVFSKNMRFKNLLKAVPPVSIRVSHSDIGDVLLDHDGA